jgi:Ca-activated chloride channel homolog
MKTMLKIILCLLPAYLTAQSSQAEKAIQSGNEFYKQQQFDRAAVQYNEALKNDPASTTAKFNLANTFSKQGQQGEAVKRFTEITDNTSDAALKGKAFYNKGAILSQQKKLKVLKFIKMHYVRIPAIKRRGKIFRKHCWS